MQFGMSDLVHVNLAAMDVALPLFLSNNRHHPFLVPCYLVPRRRGRILVYYPDHRPALGLYR